MNCCVKPAATEGLAGVTAMEVRVGTFTVSTVVPVTLPNLALIVVVPPPTGVANPAAEIVATVVVCEAQITWLVKFFVELSL